MVEKVVQQLWAVDSCGLNVLFIPLIVLICLHMIITSLVHLKRLYMFTSDDEVKEVVQIWIQEQLKSLLFRGMKMLVE